MLPIQLKNAIGIIALLFGVFVSFSIGQNDTQISLAGDMAFNDFTYAPDIGPPEICRYIKEVLPAEPLSINEESILLMIREDEKLARDYYMKMYEQWNLEVFNKLRKAEEQHMHAVLCLLEKYAVEDQIAGYQVGEFNDPELDELLPKMTRQGKNRLVDAFSVACMTEVWNLSDMIEYKALTNNEDIHAVLKELKRSTRNHIRMIHAYLAENGVHLDPCSLDDELFELIIHSNREAKSDFFEDLKVCPFFRNKVPCDQKRAKKVIN